MHQESQLVGVATINEKGQVVIPASARKALGLDSGDKLLVLLACSKNGETIGLSLLKPQALEALSKRFSENLATYKKAIEESEASTDE